LPLSSTQLVENNITLWIFSQIAAGSFFNVPLCLIISKLSLHFLLPDLIYTDEGTTREKQELVLFYVSKKDQIEL
jgi:hypothetical protein